MTRKDKDKDYELIAKLISEGLAASAYSQTQGQIEGARGALWRLRGSIRNVRLPRQPAL